MLAQDSGLFSSALQSKDATCLLYPTESSVYGALIVILNALKRLLRELIYIFPNK